MLLLPDIKNLKGPSLTFGRLIVFAIIIAIFYFLFSEIKFFFGDISIFKNKTDTNKTYIQNINNLNFDYVVSKVVDGDTLDIKRLDGEKIFNQNTEMRVRLLGINSPESVDPRKPVECFGKESSDFMKDEAFGKISAIELDDSQGTYDKYGRILAYVFVKNSGIKDENIVFLNEESVKDGYSYEYTYNLPYKYSKDFKSLEKIARNNYLNLWSPNTCDGLKTPVAKPVDDTNFINKLINSFNYNFQKL